MWVYCCTGECGFAVQMSGFDAVQASASLLLYRCECVSGVKVSGFSVQVSVGLLLYR